MSELRIFTAIQAGDIDLVGGKGLSLGLMTSAGLPVPPGFCVTTLAYRQASGSIDNSLHNLLTKAYRELGRGPVAVRSSATAEDGAVTSFAGQQETILGVEGEQQLKEAVERCWRSLHTERARAYRQHQGVEEGGLAMAVVVQRLVDAEVAGVLFTRDPDDSSGERMLIEASWGLGEAVVSGRVTPDSFRVERKNGSVRDRRLGIKNRRITPTGEVEVSAEDQSRFCLNDTQLAELAELGRQVEAFYAEPRDIEWAWAEGRFWLLQARPITTAGASDREAVRKSEIERLKKLAEPRGTVWSKYNLIEVLPDPLPMTWAVIQNLLSGSGGSGMMYRDVGFKPAAMMDHLTVYDLIGGRPYCNLSREPYLQASKPQIDYPFQRYKATPLLALTPEPDSSTMYRSVGRILRLPIFIWRQMRFARRISKLSQTFADDFRKKIVPPFLAEIEKAEAEDLTKLDPQVLLQRFEYWVKRTLVDFARESLKPTLLAQFAMQVIEQQLKKPLGPERARQAIAELTAGAHPDPEADFPTGIREMLAGTKTREQFLKQFGHRGSHEMELARPRWSEDATSLDGLLRGKRGAPETHVAMETAAQCWERIAAEAKLIAFVSKWLAGHVEKLRTYLGLRETGKHYLMRGYALIRKTLLEFDRRYRLQGGVFYLEPDDLPRLIAGESLTKTIEERRKTRLIALSLEVPPVVFSDDLEAIGRPQPAPSGATQLQGIPLSAGVVEGPALVLSEPSTEPFEPGYILVCPTTDPAWVPLFVQAKALVMESGGTLSHGAIVAREFGLPAVAGLPDIHRQLKTGQRIRVDGGRGIVSVLT
ncbi:MAG: hypothetical protein K8T89_21810 [Planctomycetes bacterium]|nr:hypothetical protein [Planctomycetota bacterium]